MSGLECLNPLCLAWCSLVGLPQKPGMQLQRRCISPALDDRGDGSPRNLVVAVDAGHHQQLLQHDRAGSSVDKNRCFIKLTGSLHVSKAVGSLYLVDLRGLRQRVELPRLLPATPSPSGSSKSTIAAGNSMMCGTRSAVGEFCAHEQATAFFRLQAHSRTACAGDTQVHGAKKNLPSIWECKSCQQNHNKAHMQV